MEKEKNWELVFDFIFSEEGLINQSYFISKHVGEFLENKLIRYMYAQNT